VCAAPQQAANPHEAPLAGPGSFLQTRCCCVQQLSEAPQALWGAGPMALMLWLNLVI
jgi:hypothetical protein